MSKTCEKCIHYDVCRYPLEYRANPDTCWKYEEERPHGEWVYIGISETTRLKIVKCTHCNKRQYGSTDFCSNCGADMRKEGEAE